VKCKSDASLPEKLSREMATKLLPTPWKKVGRIVGENPTHLQDSNFRPRIIAIFQSQQVKYSLTYEYLTSDQTVFDTSMQEGRTRKTQCCKVITEKPSAVPFRLKI